MNERDLETRLRDMYRVEAEKADPGALNERVHAIPATVEQERRRPWHGLGFGAMRNAGPGGIQVKGANNMLAATRIAAIVAALALGTTFPAVQLGDAPEPARLPHAPMDDVWVTVTGTQFMSGGDPEGMYGTRSSVSDPRLEGDVTITYERNGPYGNNSTLWSTVTITNEEGSWEGLSIGFADQQGRHHHTGWFEGTGAYEGLAYLEQLTEGEVNSAGMRLDVVGLLYEGELPPMVLPADAIE